MEVSVWKRTSKSFFFQTQIKVLGHFGNGIRLKPLTEMFSVVFDGSVSCTHTL